MHISFFITLKYVHYIKCLYFTPKKTFVVFPICTLIYDMQTSRVQDLVNQSLDFYKSILLIVNYILNLKLNAKFSRCHESPRLFTVYNKQPLLSTCRQGYHWVPSNSMQLILTKQQEIRKTFKRLEYDRKTHGLSTHELSYPLPYP